MKDQQILSRQIRLFSIIPVDIRVASRHNLILQLSVTSVFSIVASSHFDNCFLNFSSNDDAVGNFLTTINKQSVNSDFMQFAVSGTEWLLLSRVESLSLSLLASNPTDSFVCVKLTARNICRAFVNCSVGNATTKCNELRAKFLQAYETLSQRVLITIALHHFWTAESKHVRRSSPKHKSSFCCSIYVSKSHQLSMTVYSRSQCLSDVYFQFSKRKINDFSTLKKTLSVAERNYRQHSSWDEVSLQHNQLDIPRLPLLVSVWRHKIESNNFSFIAF